MSHESLKDKSHEWLLSLQFICSMQMTIHLLNADEFQFQWTICEYFVLLCAKLIKIELDSEFRHNFTNRGKRIFSPTWFNAIEKFSVDQPNINIIDCLVNNYSNSLFANFSGDDKNWIGYREIWNEINYD